MATPKTKCITCNRVVKTDDPSVNCTNCNSNYHNKCLPIYLEEDIKYANNPLNHWTCPKCLGSIFPFYEIETNEEISNFLRHSEIENLDKLNDLLFDPFEFNEDGGVFEEVDPDDNYLNVLASQTIYKCKYYLPEALSKEISNTTLPTDLSLLHLNIRSLKKTIQT